MPSSLFRKAPNFWERRGPTSLLLWPLSWVYGGIVRVRKLIQDLGLSNNHPAPVPVIIVGNIRVGGTGKTPIVIALAVMYLGKLVELAPADDLYDAPAHPYTKALLSANPRMNSDDTSERIILKGDIPNPINRPSGCVFNPRCPKVQEICKSESPALIQIGNRKVACHFPEN